MTIVITTTKPSSIWIGDSDGKRVIRVRGKYCMPIEIDLNDDGVIVEQVSDPVYSDEPYNKRTYNKRTWTSPWNRFRNWWPKYD